MKRVSDSPGLGLVIVLALLLAICVPVVAAAGEEPGDGILAVQDPTVAVWHGLNQSFGMHGDPQIWINILGNVQGANQLQYSLNGASYVDIARAGGSGTAAQALDEGLWHPGGIRQELAVEDGWTALGPDVLGPGELAVTASKRLVSPGDFNIEIDRDDLLDGQNIVTIRPNQDNGSAVEVLVNYAGGIAGQLPYIVDWSQVADIADVAQVVDGQWRIEEDGIRPTVVGYDRVVAIGDLDWQDYDVLVPITIHDFPEPGIGGVGVVARWLGHLQEDDEQPGKVWWNMGAYGLYRNLFSTEGDKSELLMYTGHFYPLSDDSGLQLDRDVPYFFRMRVQTREPGESGFYSFRVWKVGEAEPSEWAFEVQDSKPEGWQPGDPRESPFSGSVLLVAHEVDATFGDVAVRPMLELDVSKAGNGSVLVSPELEGEWDTYLHGDQIRLEAVTEPGWAFVNWSGGLSSTQNPVTLTLTADTQIVATFGLARSLDVAVDGKGSVVREPEQDAYGDGTVVMLRPTPDDGWTFRGWAGPNGDELVERGDGAWLLVIDGDKAVTALFGPSRIFLPVVKRSR